MLTCLGRAVLIRHFFTKIYTNQIKIKFLGCAAEIRSKHVKKKLQLKKKAVVFDSFC